MKKIILAVLAALTLAIVPSEVQAVSLQLKPLSYTETLQRGEKKKGFIDISNPLGQEVVVTTSVQAFRQTDDNGSLEFYDDKHIEAGIIPDLSEFTLGGRERLRMYFLIDSTKLPRGDIFAAIFVSTKANQERDGVVEGVRLGTILSIVNETPGSREAQIEELEASFFQFGTDIRGTYRIKNTAAPDTASGFYPDVTVRLEPFSHKEVVQSPLVMADRTRTHQFALEGDRLGFYQLSTEFGESKQSKWVFAMTGFWQWLLPLLIGLAVVAFFVWRTWKRRRGEYYRAR